MQIARSKTSPTISACMIVKNEEAVLPRCLASIRDYVDEIVVVDTGSTDGTVAIAESFGARVYHHPWQNDFSLHRNQSISYASGRWIFIIDADEEYRASSRRGLRQELALAEKKGVDTLSLRVENAYAQGECTAWHNSIRLFRNNGRISYMGRVHNELQGYSNSAYSPSVLQHSGYALNQAREDEKFLRTRGLLEEEIKKDPEDPRNHHYLAVALLGKRFYDLAFQEAATALRLASDRQSEPLYLWTRFVAAVSCINLGRVEEAERLCVEGVKLNPLHLDSNYLLATISYSRGLFQLFLKYSDQYLALLGKAKKTPSIFKEMVLITIDHEWRIRLHRGFTYETLGISKKARKEYALSSRACPDNNEYSRLCSEFRLSRCESATTGQLGEKERELGNEVQKGENVIKTECGISLCMIVKNEEQLLPKCLESAKDYVDEIVVVDTGSTDRTVEIAESYGARIYSHPWEGDFSKHRNQSIGYAAKEWILILDADEAIDPASAPFLRNVLKEKNADSFYLPVRSAFDNGKGEAAHNSIRLFRNNGRIRYDGRVHNRLVGEQSSSMYPVTVFHEGYNLPAEKSYQKFLRTTALLKKDIEEQPDHPRAYHYLAASYLSEGMHQEALDRATQAINLAEKHGHSDHLYLWSHFIAGISSLKLGKLEEAEKVCLRGLAKNSLHLDSHYLLVFIRFDQQQWEKVLYHGHEYHRLFEEVMTQPGKFGLIVHNTINHHWRVKAYMGLALEELHDAEGAEKAFSLAIRLCSQKGEYHKLLAGHYLSKSNLASSEAHFRKAFECLSGDLDLLKTGVEIYSRLGEREKAKELLKQVVDLDESPVESSFRLGTIMLKESSLAEATGLFQRVIAENPRHTGALINMGLVAKREKRFDEAVSFFKMALREDPFSVEGLSNLGYTLYHKGDLNGAEDALGRLTRIAPELTDPLLLLSRIHVEQGHFDRAVEDCDALLRLLKLDRSVILQSLEDLADLYLKIGETLLRDGQMTVAYWAFKTALLLAKNAPHMFQRILALYPESGHSEEALDSKEEKVDFSPSGPDNTISAHDNSACGARASKMRGGLIR